MKISFLLAQRTALQEQAHLSNLAYAHVRLSEFIRRIEVARLQGQVHLLQADPQVDRIQNSLSALQGNQSVLEEHFTERDIDDFVDAVAYATGAPMVDHVFNLSEVRTSFLPSLRAQLEKRGIDIDLSNSPKPETDRDSFQG